MTRSDVVRWAEVVPRPWKNGSGLTRELRSAGDAPGLFDWRVSVADVAASGDFSSFDGVDRIIVLVEGPAMTLTIDGVRRELTRLEPYAFDGGLPASCDVPPGPTRDLNVMTRRGRCRATVEVFDVVDPIACQVSGDGEHLFIPLAGQVSITSERSDEVVLELFDLLRARATGRLTLRGDGPVARIEISRARALR
jgi:environmental stress-induced protein Ves